MEKREPRWLEVLKVSLPLCLSYIAIGLACGILLNKAGFVPLLALLVSLTVFSGGAQFLIASMVLAHSPLHTILIMLFFLELRYALLGSSLSQYVRGKSKRFVWAFAISMNDENYAVNYLKFMTDKKWTPSDALMVEHYSLLFWSVSNLVGCIIGGVIHINLAIVDFALTSLFIYMIVMQMRSRLTIVISVLSGVIAAIAMVALKSTMGLVVATIIASLTGFFIEDRLRKAGKAKGFWLKHIISPGSDQEEIAKEE
ncbi:AzlC family ABC transporter permease [Ligilactobacillus hohenheimensis]|uniref:AzlC family ABC transporter permease n=1 Tax=Ligilactobacillus hohenheimensis TaxID=2991832 RepID=UPI001F860FBC|nr:AzlC family ABC transporter permease [Ligilactobacillus hohenheimensis]HJC03545.1 AzlC family ABC transporter permease [Candidatus Ligilactobacillus avistercoris]